MTRPVSTLLLLVLLACPAVAAQTGTPEHCLREVQNALDSKNLERFERLVDMRAMTNKAVDTLLEDAAQPDTDLPPLLALVLSSAQKSPQATATLRDLLVQETEAFVRYGVRSGHFAGKPDQGVLRSGGMLAPLFSDVSPGRKELSASGPASYDEDGQALLPATLRDEGNGNSYPLLLRMQRTPSGRRITEIVNLRELWELLLHEARQRR